MEEEEKKVVLRPHHSDGGTLIAEYVGRHVATLYTASDGSCYVYDLVFQTPGRSFARQWDALQWLDAEAPELYRLLDEPAPVAA